MNERNLAFLYSPEAEALSYPPDCPFKTQRAGCTRLRLKSLGLLGDEKHFESAPRRASISELKQFHTAHYLEEIRRAAEGDLTVEGLRMGFGEPDTPVFKNMFDSPPLICCCKAGRISRSTCLAVFITPFPTAPPDFVISTTWRSPASNWRMPASGFCIWTWTRTMVTACRRRFMAART
jgi:hypothetical protein